MVFFYPNLLLFFGGYGGFRFGSSGDVIVTMKVVSRRIEGQKFQVMRERGQGHMGERQGKKQII